MADSPINRARRRAEALKADRQTWDPHWRDLSDLILPRRSRFVMSDANRGEAISDMINNNIATMAARTLSAGMMAGMTSPARPWFRLVIGDADLSDNPEVKAWLKVAQDRIQRVFHRSNFYQALPIVYLDIGVFGTASMLLLEDPRDVIRLYPMPIGSYWLGTDHRRTVNTVYREMQMNVEQVVEEYGLDACSRTIQADYERGNYRRAVQVGHLIEPRRDRDPGKKGAKNMPFASLHWEIGTDEGEFLRDSGFREWPAPSPRWQVTGEDIYGRCPGMDALSDIKALQLEEEMKAEAIDKVVRPPMVGSPALQNKRASIMAGDITYVEQVGQAEAFKPAFQVKPDLPAILGDIRVYEERINRAFYTDLFLMLLNTDRRQITAEEIKERREEKMLQLGPVVEQVGNELIDVAIIRTFNIMLRGGAIPAPPPIAQGVEYTIDKVSVLAQAQKMIGMGALDQWTAYVANLAEYQPQVLDKADFDEAADQAADMLGVPPKLLVPDDEVAAIRKQRQEQQQMAEAAAAAPDAARAVKDLSGAQMGQGSALDQLIDQASGQ